MLKICGKTINENWACSNFVLLAILGEVVRLLETDGDFLVRETVRNEEKQIVLSVSNGFNLSLAAHLLRMLKCLLQWLT